MSDEWTPLLENAGPAGGQQSTQEEQWDHHFQFCHLIGIRPRNIPPDQKYTAHPESLYARAVHHRRIQNFMYSFTATFTNTLLLSQVVLGAALTGLGASNSSHVLITVFGALNTVIAGVVAFLKSRGQPMRARMFRDDLERVVDEIENSAIMWLGISKGAHGYDAIDIDDEVTVRGEVARLTRLYDKAVKIHTLNDPDMYSTGAPGDLHTAALRDRTAAPAPVSDPPAPTEAPAPAPAPTPAADPDASPATLPPEASKPKSPDLPADAKAASSTDQSSTKPATTDKGTSAATTAGPSGSNTGSSSSPAATAQPASNATAPEATPAPLPAPASADPDESPATAAHMEKHSQDTSKNDEDKK